MNEVAGRYALFGEIAAGGMATVYFGRLLGDGGFSRTVAIKRLHPHYAKNSAFVAMFLDEARLAARIQHPNVVPTLDVVAMGQDVLLVLEYVHGESLAALHLATRKRGDKIRVPIVLSILSCALHGLHAAHEARNERGEPLGIVHRDVSPQNILVGADGVPRILDFGVAKAAGRIQATREGQLKGKLAYMAPEQLQDGVVDRTTDVYAAGIVLWEALAGRRLFHGESEAAVVTKVLSDEVPPPSKLTAGVTHAIDNITLRALSRDKKHRFQSAREMALALESCGIPPAMPSQIGEWVMGVSSDVLKKRTQVIAELERQSSRSRTLDAKELVDQLGSVNPPPSGSSPPPPPSIPPLSPLPRFGSASRISAPQFTTPGMTARKRSRSAPTSQKAIIYVVSALAALTAILGIVAFRALGPASGTEPSPSATVAPVSCPPGMAAVAAGNAALSASDPAGPAAVGAFCIDVFEVTTDDYRACVQSAGCRPAGQKNEWPTITEAERMVLDPLCNARAPEDRGKHPINCVSWDMAEQFCKAHQKRLPHEAEWEMAALGNDGRRYPWGNDDPTAKLLNACGRECVDWGRRSRIDKDALFPDSDGYPTTAPVGAYPEGKSAAGAFDMLGNVWEWVDGVGRRPDQRVLRGGAWNASSLGPSATRSLESMERRSYSIGFRCAR